MIPRKKREGLIDGVLWLDRETAIAVRESGYLAKSPSVFVERINLTRENDLHNGTIAERITHVSVEMRLFGQAQPDYRGAGRPPMRWPSEAWRKAAYANSNFRAWPNPGWEPSDTSALGRMEEGMMPPLAQNTSNEVRIRCLARWGEPCQICLRLNCAGGFSS
jgi:hypothetical protein